MTIEEIRKAALLGKLSEAQLQAAYSLYESKRLERLDYDRKSAACKKIEDEVLALAIDHMLKGTVKSFSLGEHTVALEGPAYVPHVDSWEKLQAHIVATSDFALLERRVGRSYIQEQWEHGIIVPGIEKYPVFKLSKTKVKT